MYEKGMRITHVVEVGGSQIITLDAFESVKVGSRFSRKVDVWDIVETDHIQTTLGRLPIFRVRSLTGGPDLEEGEEIVLLDTFRRPIVYDTNEAMTPLLTEPKVGQNVIILRGDGAEFFKVSKDREGFFAKSYAARDPEIFRIAHSGVNWYVSQPR